MFANATNKNTAMRGKAMKRRLFDKMLTAACAIAPLALLPAAPAAAQSVVRPAQDITLAIGNGQLIQASTFGEPLNEKPIYESDFFAATRPLGATPGAPQ